MRHNAGAHGRRVINPSKWALIIVGVIITMVIIGALLIALYIA